MEKINKQNFLRHCGWLGIIGTLFYFLHIIVGNIIYDGYSPISQAISDLTAKGAPSEIPARVFSSLYGVFNVAFVIIFYIFFRKKINKVFTLATLLFLIMAATSAIGYTIFPLSEVGYANTFQDTMHVVVTIIVVILSIAALVLFAVSFIRNRNQKWMGFAAIVTLGLMMIGSMLLGAIPAILGIAERINIYALQIYTTLLAVFLIKYKDLSKQEHKTLHIGE